MALEKPLKAYVYKSDTHFVANCLNIAVVTQGKTLDEAMRNLQEAVGLHLEGEDLEAMGLAPHPLIVATVELEPANASAY